MASEREEEIRKALAAITQYPWVAEGMGSEGYWIKTKFHGSALEHEQAYGFRRATLAEVRGGRDWKELRANAEFMARSPEYVEAVLKRVDELETAGRHLHEVVNTYHQGDCDKANVVKAQSQLVNVLLAD